VLDVRRALYRNAASTMLAARAEHVLALDHRARAVSDDHELVGEPRQDVEPIAGLVELQPTGPPATSIGRAVWIG